jgi:RNA polymerase sigma factor (sigma-70 family)
LEVRVARQLDDDEFCRRLQPMVYGALLLYCANNETAAELTQETLARAWQHRSSVSTMEHPDRWALRVAFNLAKSMFRRRSVARDARRFVSTTEPVCDADPLDRMLLRAVIATLPPRQRAAVVLRYYNDLTVSETAHVLGCADGTVKALTSQAIAGLRQRLRAIDFALEEHDA